MVLLGWLLQVRWAKSKPKCSKVDSEKRDFFKKLRVKLIIFAKAYISE